VLNQRVFSAVPALHPRCTHGRHCADPTQCSSSATMASPLPLLPSTAEPPFCSSPLDSFAALLLRVHSWDPLTRLKVTNRHRVSNTASCITQTTARTQLLSSPLLSSLLLLSCPLLRAPLLKQDRPSLRAFELQSSAKIPVVALTSWVCSHARGMLCVSLSTVNFKWRLSARTCVRIHKKSYWRRPNPMDRSDRRERSARTVCLSLERTPRLSTQVRVHKVKQKI
jgi:hypothetical protein